MKGSRSDYILGQAMAVLEKVRAYFITQADEKGLAVIENDYQVISDQVKDHYHSMEK
jgi:hypothetical protein